MMNRSARANIAKETVDIAIRGEYVAGNGTRVSIAREVADAIEKTRLYRPGELPHEKSAAPSRGETSFEVTGETTLAAARRLVESGKYSHLCALNFASARHPGGGFLGGSLAQEESLATASALYASISKQVDYYRENDRTHDGFYTDHLIFSPRVPVFRDDDSTLLARPYLLSFITSPAVNAGVVHRDPLFVPRIADVMRKRVAIVLNAAIDNGVDCLILGAWGCGVFKNDPEMIAQLFAGALLENGIFAGAFRHVCFAVYSPRGQDENLEPFKRRFP
jgi:uncharacterized protein (TIGR02452 family)